jgi:hypothetical protein
MPVGRGGTGCGGDPAPYDAAVPSLASELDRQAHQAPRIAILEAHDRLYQSLALSLVPFGFTPHAGLVSTARAARAAGLLSERTLSLIEAIGVLRNIAAHGPPAFGRRGAGPGVPHLRGRGIGRRRQRPARLSPPRWGGGGGGGGGGGVRIEAASVRPARDRAVQAVG